MLCIYILFPKHKQLIEQYILYLLSRKFVEDALKELIDRHLAFNSNRLFKLLEVISVLNNQLVKQILPRIKELVVITEAKRGIGVDSTLR